MGDLLEKYEADGYDIEWATSFVHGLTIGEVVSIIIDSKGRQIKYKMIEGTFDGGEIVYEGEIDPNFDIRKYIN